MGVHHRSDLRIKSSGSGYSFRDRIRNEYLDAYINDVSSSLSDNTGFVEEKDTEYEKKKSSRAHPKWQILCVKLHGTTILRK